MITSSGELLEPKMKISHRTVVEYGPLCRGKIGEGRLPLDPTGTRWNFLSATSAAEVLMGL